MEKPTLKEAVAALMTSRFPDDAETTGDALLSVGLPPTGASFVALGLMKKCCTGDSTAIKLLREITGEAEPQPVINISGASSFSNFTDAELESLLQ